MGACCVDDNGIGNCNLDNSGSTINSDTKRFTGFNEWNSLEAHDEYLLIRDQ
jgi:hypothetical protein